MFRAELFQGGCTDENYYGYPEAKPCIMVCLLFSFISKFKIPTLLCFHINQFQSDVSLLRMFSDKTEQNL